MRQVIVTADVTGATAPVILDQYQDPTNVTYSKSGSGTVEVSVTAPYPVVNGNFVPATFVWTTAPTTYPNGTDFLGQPFTAIRLTGASQGDTLTVIQSGVKG